MNIHDVHILPWYDSGHMDPRGWLTLYMTLLVKVHETKVYGARPFVLATPSGSRLYVAVKAAHRSAYQPAEEALRWLMNEGLPEDDALDLLRRSAKADPQTS